MNLIEPSGPVGINVPPWHYQPVAPFSYRLTDDAPFVVSQGMVTTLEDLAATLGTYAIPPREGQLLLVLDDKSQCIFAWVTNGPAQYWGVEAVFTALGPHVEPISLFEMELDAKGRVEGSGL